LRTCSIWKFIRNQNLLTFKRWTCIFLIILRIIIVPRWSKLSYQMGNVAGSINFWFNKWILWIFAKYKPDEKGDSFSHKILLSQFIWIIQRYFKPFFSIVSIWYPFRWISLKFNKFLRDFEENSILWIKIVVPLGNDMLTLLESSINFTLLLIVLPFVSSIF
jgi:hypothetical protein